MSRTSEMLDLQEADDAVAAVRAQVDEVAARLAGDPELDRQRAVAGAAGEEWAAADRALKTGEADLAALTRRAAQLERRLYDGSVRNPQELLGMQRELEQLRGRVGEAEDGVLALMERAEQTAAARVAADATAELMTQRRAAAAGPDAVLLDGLRERLRAATADRDGLATRLTDSDAALYARVAGRRRPAVVRLAGDACGGCHLPLSIHELHRVRVADGVVQCSNCDRILAP